MQATPMMADERFESARKNFGKFIHQFQPETKTLIRKLETKLYKQNVSLLFNHIYIYIIGLMSWVFARVQYQVESY